MTVFRMQDSNGAWTEFVEWLCSLSLYDFNNAKFDYHQEVTRIRVPGTHEYQRVFVISIEDESVAAYFKLRWSGSLLV